MTPLPITFAPVLSSTRTLRSSSDALVLRVPHAKLVTAGQRAFSYSGPSTWNPLPLQASSEPYRCHLQESPKDSFIPVADLTVVQLCLFVLHAVLFLRIELSVTGYALYKSHIIIITSLYINNAFL